MVTAAQATGNTADAARYANLSAYYGAAYKAAYYDPATGKYLDGRPISQLFALDLGLPTPAEEPLVYSVLRADVANGTMPLFDVWGIITTKLLFPVLEAHGDDAIGLAIVSQTQQPSFGYWVDQGLTTLPESWLCDATNAAASYNHIMFGGSGDWLYRSIAGIRRNAGARSWTSLTIKPPASVPSSNLSYASASIDTPMGTVAVAWADISGDVSYAACGVGEEHANLTLTCLGPDGQPGTPFTGIAFASFGTPTGDCVTGFTVDPTCDSPQSHSVVQAACVGKNSCTILADTTTFGGDPCVDVLKHLSVGLLGTCMQARYSLTVTVPVGATATVAVPTLIAAASAAITESGTTVWASNAFVPGAPGVTSGTAGSDGVSVVFTVGSGTYAFVASG